MRNRIASTVFLFAAALLPASGDVAAGGGQPDAPAVLDLAAARMALAGAAAEAAAHRAGGAIAIVDAGGHLVAFERLDGTFPAAAQVSIGKAKTAAMFRKPTADLEKSINDGRTALLGAMQEFTPLQGGVPIVMNGVVVGGIGVSGASSAAEDEQVAKAGAAVFASAH